MKAIILAAGEAKRLRPISYEMPKCMLTIDGKAIISYQIDNLVAAGITEAVVVTGYMAEKLEGFLTKTHPHFSFIFIRSKDYAKTYPAHGLWLAKEYLNESCLYLNADVICHPRIISSVVNDIHESCTAMQRNPWDEEEVNIILEESSNKVLELGKHISKSLSSGEFMGVTKIAAQFNTTLIEVLDEFIEREEFKKFAADALNLTIQRGETMHALDVSHLPAIEIDTKEDLESAHAKLEEIKKDSEALCSTSL